MTYLLSWWLLFAVWVGHCKAWWMGLLPGVVGLEAYVVAEKAKRLRHRGSEATWPASIRSAAISKADRWPQLAIWLGGVAFSILQLHTIGRTTMMQSRPWVDFSLGDRMIELEPGKPAHWRVELVNHGALPASYVSWNVRVFDPNETPNFTEIEASIDHMRLEGAAHKILLQQQSSMDEGDGTEQLSKKQIDRIQQGALSLVVGGKVGYVDTNSKGHSSAFCAIYIPGRHGTSNGYKACPLTEKLDDKDRPPF